MALTNSMKIRGTQNLKLVEVAKEICEYLLNWEIAITAKYLFKLAECSSKLGISKQLGFLRSDAKSWNFSECLPSKGFSWDRFACIPSFTSDTYLRCMETRSSQSCKRCISAILGRNIPVWFSSILHDSKSSQQYSQGKISKADINNPSLDSTSLVSKDFEHLNRESYFAALEKRAFEKSQRGNFSPSSEQHF